MNKSSGQACFNAYREAVNATAYDGTRIPEWGNVSASIKYAWEQGAKAAIHHEKMVRMGEVFKLQGVMTNGRSD